MMVIEIIVNPAGQTTVQTKGFSGATCRDASRALENALGLVEQDRPTAEMYERAPAEHQPLRQQGQG